MPGLGYRIQNSRLPNNFYHLATATWVEKDKSSLLPAKETADNVCAALNRKPKYKNAIIVIPN